MHKNIQEKRNVLTSTREDMNRYLQTNRDTYIQTLKDVKKLMQRKDQMNRNGQKEKINRNKDMNRMNLE